VGETAAPVSCGGIVRIEIATGPPRCVFSAGMKAFFFSCSAISLCGPASFAEPPTAGAPIDLRSVHTIRGAHPKGVAALAIFGDSQFLLSVGNSREVKFGI
jgi:hypothetical protein